MREIPQVGCEGFSSRTLSAALRLLSQNHCDGPTDQTQAISAEAFEHWLVESDSPLFVLDASGAVIFRNPAAANLPQCTRRRRTAFHSAASRAFGINARRRMTKPPPQIYARWWIGVGSYNCITSA